MPVIEGNGETLLCFSIPQTFGLHQKERREVWGHTVGILSALPDSVSSLLFTMQTRNSNHNCFTATHEDGQLKIILMNRY